MLILFTATVWHLSYILINSNSNECRQTSTDISTKTIWKTPQVYANDTSAAGDSNSSEPALPAVPISADSKLPMKRNQTYATQRSVNDRHVRLPGLEHEDRTHLVQREKVGKTSSPRERIHAVQRTETIATPRLMTSDRNDQVQQGTGGGVNSRKSNKPEVDILIERKESFWRYRSCRDNDHGQYQSIPEVDAKYSYKNATAECNGGGCSDPPKCYTRHWDPTSGLYVIAELDIRSLDGKVIETNDGSCKDNQTMEYLMNVDRLCRDATNNNASDGCCPQH